MQNDDIIEPISMVYWWLKSTVYILLARFDNLFFISNLEELLTLRQEFSKDHLKPTPLAKIGNLDVFMLKSGQNHGNFGKKISTT